MNWAKRRVLRLTSMTIGSASASEDEREQLLGRLVVEQQPQQPGEAARDGGDEEHPGEEAGDARERRVAVVPPLEVLPRARRPAGPLPSPRHQPRPSTRRGRCARGARVSRGNAGRVPGALTRRLARAGGSGRRNSAAPRSRVVSTRPASEESRRTSTGPGTASAARRRGPQQRRGRGRRGARSAGRARAGSSRRHRRRAGRPAGRSPASSTRAAARSATWTGQRRSSSKRRPSAPPTSACTSSLVLRRAVAEDQRGARDDRVGHTCRAPRVSAAAFAAPYGVTGSGGAVSS